MRGMKTVTRRRFIQFIIAFLPFFFTAFVGAYLLKNRKGD